MTRPMIAALLALVAGIAPGAAAPQRSVSLADSFQIGSNALCSAQLSPPRAGDGMFDRAYALVCRDANVPVGHLYALRGSLDAAIQRIGAPAGGGCTPGEETGVDGIGQVRVLRCGGGDGAVAYAVARGGVVYVAHGVKGYDSALRVGLRTIAFDRPVDAPVEIAITGNSDAAAFARAQAAQLSSEAALAEAYRRSNAGNYAAAAEFFAVATGRADATDADSEALLNAALQQSNLGNYARADELFAQAAPGLGADPVLTRMARNFRAIDRLNQGDRAGALTRLAEPLPAMTDQDPALSSGRLAIGAALARRLRAEARGAAALDGAESALLPAERVQVLDAQAAQIRGTVARLNGNPVEARGQLQSALAGLATVRGGRVGSLVWLRAQIGGDLAALAEGEGDRAEAERLYRDAAALVETRYPASPALLSSRAQLASFLARTGRTEEALPLYGSVVTLADQAPTPGLKRLLAPYLRVLAERADRPEAVAAMFAAGQALVRPGVAQTQAVLARELTSGSDEASALFRRSLNLQREIERARIAAAAISADGQMSNADSLRVAELNQRVASLGELQLATQSELAGYARYRAVAEEPLDLPALQEALREGEAYLKLVVLDQDSYGLFVTRTGARAYRIGLGEAALARTVEAIRRSIALEEDGRVVTNPFDVARARALYLRLFGPLGGAMGEVRHLIFEPDGAMLSLPVNLLLTSDQGIAQYQARSSSADEDIAFDFTGLAWLGRDTDVTTTVSAAGFRNIRRARPSDARRSYLGLGQNAPVGALEALTGTRSVSGGDSRCQWGLQAWSRPISADELVDARDTVTRLGAGGGEVLTGTDFSDTRIKAMETLGDYRVLHFATHGLVTAPRPDCPARPALLTSFGDEGSDGLLTFAEIFDLKLDADLVILSACDTAGSATVASTREAGLASGGGSALDGLVRAFVGAGSRSVVASHWPVPDDYGATARLVSGLFRASPGTGSAEALRVAQRQLMDDRRTSHPYYWSAFAIVGDGAIPVIRTAAAAN